MMNKTNYKTIAVVAVNNVSIAMSVVDGKAKHVKQFGQNNLVASLKVLKQVLNGVDNNDNLTNNPVLIIIGSKSPIKGFATGTFVEYLRTGANASGKQFTEEEMNLIKEITTLYANKCFNFRITTDEFVSAKDKVTKGLINSAWNQVKKIAQEMQNQTKEVKETKEKQDKQTNDVVAKLNEQLISAVSKGDFETATKITELIKNLTATTQELNDTLDELEEGTNEEYIPEDVTTDEPDSLAGVDDME